MCVYLDIIFMMCIFIASFGVSAHPCTKGDTGQGDVVVTADSGAAAIQQNAWEYVVAGNISLVSPSSGQNGTIVNISGTNLLVNSATNIITYTFAWMFTFPHTNNIFELATQLFCIYV